MRLNSIVVADNREHEISQDDEQHTNKRRRPRSRRAARTATNATASGHTRKHATATNGRQLATQLRSRTRQGDGSEQGRERDSATMRRTVMRAAVRGRRPLRGRIREDDGGHLSFTCFVVFFFLPILFLGFSDPFSFQTGLGLTRLLLTHKPISQPICFFLPLLFGK